VNEIAQDPNKSPYTWLRQIPGSLFKADDKPLLGFSPPFAWKKMEQELKASLQLQSLSIETRGFQWRSENEKFSGLSDDLATLKFSIAPLEGFGYFAMPTQDVNCLISLLLAEGAPLQDTSLHGEAIDQDFFNAFYRFIAFEVMSIFDKISPDKKLSPKLCQDNSIPEGDYLAQDINITLGDKTLFARFFFSQELKNALRSYRIAKLPNQMLASPLADDLEVTLHIEAGSIQMTHAEWKTIRVGDVILTDQCTLNPDGDKGRVMLTINGVTYFRARIKNGTLKILEHPLYFKADTMDSTKKRPEDDEDEEDIFADDDLDLDLDLEEDEDEEDENESYDLSDLNFEEDEEVEAEKTLAEETAESSLSAKEATAAPSSEATKDASLQTAAPPPLEEVALQVVIELGRIQLSVRKLLELQPGNMLDLNLHPEAGVDLVVNGKRIAKAEMIHIGESLGIRIQELA